MTGPRTIHDEFGRTCSSCGVYKKWAEFNRQAESVTTYRSHCKPCVSSSMAVYHRAQKREVMLAYGGVCACCGESELGFLTIDHVNSNGNAHRKEIGARRIYPWLIKNEYPAGFQVLCYNCNSGRDKNGGVCPHIQGVEDMKVSIGTAEFATKAAAIAACRNIRDSYAPGERVSSAEHDSFLRELLAAHEEYAEKLGDGIDHFFVDTAAHGTRCFYLVRVDGSKDDFSFMSCLKGASA